MFVLNQFRFAVHCSIVGSVLQVPHKMAFNAVRLACDSMNASEFCWSKENGRHSRKASDCVMFRKKDWHPTVEKFCDSVVSNGWGKGFGSSGGVDGIVGTDWSEEDADDEGAAAPEELDAVGDGNAIDDPEDEASAGSGSGCLLWGCQVVNVDSHESQLSDSRVPESASNAAGCEMRRVDAVTRMRMAGTTRIVHLVLRAVLFLASEDRVCSSSLAVTGDTHGEPRSKDENEVTTLGDPSGVALCASGAFMGYSERKGGGDEGGVNIAVC